MKTSSGLKDLKVGDSRKYGNYVIRTRSNGDKTIELFIKEFEELTGLVPYLKNRAVIMIPTSEFKPKTEETVEHPEEHTHEWIFEGSYLARKFMCECGEVYLE